MHFVLGHPRSGTNLLTDLLNAGGARWAAHEAMIVLSPGAALIEAATAYYEGRLGAAQVNELLAGCPDPLPCPVEVSWKSAWIVPVLMERYPEARFLHLARDPRRNVIGCHNLDYYGRIPLDDVHERWSRAMPAIRRPDWEDLSPFERNCAFWVETHRLVLDALSARPDRYDLIRLEDLQDPAVAARVFCFFDLPVPSEDEMRRVLSTPVNAKVQLKGRVARSKGDLLPAFEECPPEVQAALRRICGPMAARLGYDVDAGPGETETTAEALRRARSELVAVRAQLGATQEQLVDAQQRIEALERTRSWRVTRPLRWGTAILADARNDGVLATARAEARRVWRAIVAPRAGRA